MRLLFETDIAIWAALDLDTLTEGERARMSATDTPLGHKEPFDELLLVQAQEEGMRRLTRDAKLADHPFAVAGG